jgi:hypothetical protein
MPCDRATLKLLNSVMDFCPAYECASVRAVGIGRLIFVMRRVNDAGSTSVITCRLQRQGGSETLKEAIKQGATPLGSVAMLDGGSRTREPA